MLDSLRRRVAKFIAPKRGARMYAAARGSRFNDGFGSFGNASADAELNTSLTQLRARSRQLMRDAPYAKRARTIVVNNVIGTGVGIQSQVKNSRNALHETINTDIESAWEEWSCAENCHTGGALHFSDLERTCLAEVFTAGEVILRKHYSAFGDSQIPFALELIEAERIADSMLPGIEIAPGNQFRLGIEVDQFQRPVAYFIRERHPGDYLNAVGKIPDRVIKVPADQIYHLRLVDRWPQTRGEPWLHAVVSKLNNMDEYSASELLAARLSANYFATIKSPEEQALATTVADDGTRQINIEPGVIEQLNPGDELDFHSPDRPNTALDPFLRYMLREVAAGIGVSYESISRDYSQSNYSSSRLGILDDRDMWKMLQQWWVRSFREDLHEDWLKSAVLSGAIPSVSVASYVLDTERFECVRWKLRGWSWVDPQREVAAYNDAIAGNLTTVTDVIEQTGNGQDIEDYIEKRTRELDMFKKAGIEHPVVTKPSASAAAIAADTANTDDTANATGQATNGQQPQGRVVPLRGAL